MLETLQTTLFPGDGENTYAVLDGASCEELPQKLEEFRPECICLYAGELASDVKAVAPHLIELLPEHPFTDWLLTEGFGKHWGIFVRSEANIRVLRKHFRSFLRIRDPEGKILYFRYYDPRVLQTYLPTCEAREIRAVFGPVSSYLAETTKPPALLQFHVEGGSARQRIIALPA